MNKKKFGSIILPICLLISCTNTNINHTDACARIQEINIQNDDKNIYSKIYFPNLEQEKYPVVFLSPSHGLTCDSLNQYCIEFSKRNYLAVTFDFCGGSSSSRSDGNPKEMTLFTEESDLLAIVETIKNYSYVDSSNMILFGTSQGGLVSALLANDEPEFFSKMILLYPGFSIPEQIKNSYDDQNPFLSLGNIGQSYIDTLLDFDVYEHLANFTKEVLIIHGSNDFIVPVSYSERAKEIYKNCTLQIIEGANHGFNSENYSFFANYDEQVWQFIDEFL